VIAFFSIFLVISCNVLDSDINEKSTNLNGSVLTNDRGHGVPNALIQVFQADTLVQKQLTDNQGNFDFEALPSGQKRVKLLLPEGFKYAGDFETTIEANREAVIEFTAIPIREIKQVVDPGGVDTLAVSSGTFMEVDASAFDIPIEVSFEEVEDQMDNSFFDSKPIKISIRQQGTSKSIGSADGIGSSSSLIGTAIGIKVWKYFRGLNDGREIFAYNVSSDANPVYLYADAEKTIYIDPRTGEESSVSLHSFQYSGADFDLTMQSYVRELDDECEGSEYRDLRELKRITNSEDPKKALILVHGWQPFKFKCEQFIGFDPAEGNLGGLIQKLSDEPSVRSKYDLYIYKYPTNSHILAASEDLQNRIEQRELDKPVIIGHSMGGLVGRGLISAFGKDQLSGMITLGTPHRGSPLASNDWVFQAVNLAGTALACDLFPNRCISAIIDGGLFPPTDGLNDLSIESDFIQRLIDLEEENNNIFTLGGLINSESSDTEKKYKFGNFLMSLNGFENDGIVPSYSSVPEWSFLQTTLSEHDHSVISNSNDVIEQLKPVLSTLADCGTPPTIVSRNDFRLSGSIGRESGATIRVTLNSIKVAGEIASDLNRENFMVIENNCIKNINSFSTENVGVDIVFIQDLSGSMGGAISGVKSSVISFADELASKGINAKFGSVGYSGDGSIPSDPASSTCEYIGPVRDFTEPDRFQAHVSGNWNAYQGCDIPENGLEAIKYAHQNLSWRSGAARVYIDITDASHHTAETSCNGLGNCTNQTLESIVNLVGETSTIHAVAPSSSSSRRAGGGLDPWLLAEATGGEKLVLPSNGFVDLNRIGIADIVSEAVSFTFESSSPRQAIHSLRIRAEIRDRVAELTPDLVRYKSLSSDLRDDQ
jgi:hypothetical protein